MSPQKSSYGRTTQVLHWIGALLIIAMAVIGIVMTRVPDGGTQVGLYCLHVGLGLVVLAVTIARLLWRLRDPWPAPPAGLSPFRELAFKWNHILLYVVVLALLSSGAATLLLSGLALSPAAVSPEAIQEVPPKKAHELLSKVFMALFLMHLGGVVQYQLRKGDTFSRIGVGWLKK